MDLTGLGNASNYRCIRTTIHEWSYSPRGVYAFVRAYACVKLMSALFVSGLTRSSCKWLEIESAIGEIKMTRGPTRCSQWRPWVDKAQYLLNLFFGAISYYGLSWRHDSAPSLSFWSNLCSPFWSECVVTSNNRLNLTDYETIGRQNGCLHSTLIQTEWCMHKYSNVRFGLRPFHGSRHRDIHEVNISWTSVKDSDPESRGVFSKFQACQIINQIVGSTRRYTFPASTLCLSVRLKTCGIRGTTSRLHTYSFFTGPVLTILGPVLSHL